MMTFCGLQAAPHPPATPAEVPAAPNGVHAAGSLAGALTVAASRLPALTPGMPPTPATPLDLSIGEGVHRRKRATAADADHAPPPVYLSNNHIRTREKGALPPRTPVQKRIRTQVSCRLSCSAPSCQPSWDS